MFGIMLFLHLTGLAVWLGSLAAVGVLLTLLRKRLEQPGCRPLARSVIRVFNILTHPSAFVVLITGLVMVLTEDYGEDKPLWLSYMQNAGGLIVILTTALLSIFGKRASRRLAGSEASGTKKNAAAGVVAAGKSLSLLVSLMVVSIVLILSVVLAVSYRFG